ncbi:MAG: sugar-binding protein [Candidatus Ratteibacteria bacterium]
MKKVILKFLLLVFSVFGGEVLICQYKPDPPISIDGDLDDWVMISKSYEIRGENVVYGKNKWKNEKDLSGTILICWRNEGLYIGIEVIDDKIVQNMSGKDLWKGDHIEIYIDTKWTPEAKGIFREGQFHIGISPGNLLNTGDPIFDMPPEFYIWHPENLKTDEKIIVASKKTENGYNVEGFIPFKLLGMRIKEGEVIGIDICISDTDTPDIQEKMTSLIKDKEWKCQERSRLLPLKFTGASK